MPHELKLYDVIGGWGISAAELTDGIPEDAEEIVLRVNSPGGAVGEGLAMYHYLSDHPARVTAIVDGYAASSASFVILAADEVRVHEASILMLHNPWGVAVGDAEEMRHTAGVLDEHAEAILDIYERRTGMARTEIRDLMESETWMRGEAAVDRGFADSIIEADAVEDRVAAMVGFAAVMGKLKGDSELMSAKSTQSTTGRKDQMKEQIASQAEKITGLEGQVEALTGERDVAQARVGELEADIAAGVESKTELEATLSAEREANAQALEVLTGERDEAQGQVEALTGERDEAKAKLRVAEERLADPSREDAGKAAVPAQDAVQTAADAEADELEKQAAAEAANAPQLSLWEQYYALEDATARREFYKANEAALKAEHQQVTRDNG